MVIGDLNCLYDEDAAGAARAGFGLESADDLCDAPDVRPTRRPGNRAIDYALVLGHWPNQATRNQHVGVTDHDLVSYLFTGSGMDTPWLYLSIST